MTKMNKVLLALLLVFVMVFAAACGGDGEIKQPANVNGDSSGETNGTGTNNDSGSSDEEVTIA